jgi:hypothetical protein
MYSHDTLFFLQTLYSTPEYPADWTYEIRCLSPSGGRPVSCFFPLTQSAYRRGAEFAARLRDEYHAYAGVLPRTEGKGEDGYISASGWLWADIDAGKGNHDDVMTKLSLVKEKLPAPEMVVQTGSGGAHLYWRLSEPYQCPDTDTRENLRSLIRRIAQLIGTDGEGAHADPAVCNPSRIMRLPGTWNHKHSPARRVRMVYRHGAESKPFTWWDTNLPYEKNATPIFEKAQRERPTFWGGVSPGMEQWAMIGFPEGQRHRKLLGAAVWLKSLPDLSQGEAFDLFIRKVVASNCGAKSLIDRQEAEGLWNWRGA